MFFCSEIRFKYTFNNMLRNSTCIVHNIYIRKIFIFFNTYKYFLILWIFVNLQRVSFLQHKRVVGGGVCLLCPIILNLFSLF